MTDTKPTNTSTLATAQNSDSHSAGSVIHELAELRHDPEAIRRSFETGEYPYHTKMRRAAYENQKARLQAELLKVPPEQVSEEM